MRELTPAGFRENAAGLLVPDAISRERRVATKAEFKAVEKAMGVLAFHGLKFKLACDNPRCQGQSLQKIPGADGSVTLRCEHRDLVFSNAI